MSGIETLALVSMVSAAAGTAVSAVGAIQQGNAQKAALDAQSKARERQAMEQRAASQREAISRSDRARLVLSQQQAAAAASGGGASDKSVLDIMGRTAAEGAYQSASAIYEGEASGAGLEYQARMDRQSGRQSRLAGFINAGSTVLQGVGYGANVYGTAKGTQASKARAAQQLRFG